MLSTVAAIVALVVRVLPGFLTSRGCRSAPGSSAVAWRSRTGAGWTAAMLSLSGTFRSVVPHGPARRMRQDRLFLKDGVDPDTAASRLRDLVGESRNLRGRVPGTNVASGIRFRDLYIDWVDTVEKQIS